MGVLWLNLGCKPEVLAGQGKQKLAKAMLKACPKQVALVQKMGKCPLYDLNTTGGETTNAGWRAPVCT